MFAFLFQREREGQLSAWKGKHENLPSEKNGGGMGGPKQRREPEARLEGIHLSQHLGLETAENAPGYRAPVHVQNAFLSPVVIKRFVLNG